MRTKTFLPLIPSKVKDFSALSSLTGTLTGSVEPTLTSAELRSDVASECAVLVAPESREAILFDIRCERWTDGCASVKLGARDTTARVYV